jgi:hypothetical protein
MLSPQLINVTYRYETVILQHQVFSEKQDE